MKNSKLDFSFNMELISKILLIGLIFIFASCKEASIEPTLYGTIKGKVIDAETSEPIAGASISSTPPTSSVVTSTDGSYKISDVPVGNYSVAAQKFGYNKQTTSVAVKENMDTEAAIFMEKIDYVNNPPETPINPSPQDGSNDLETNLTLSWSAEDIDQNDSLFYDVYIYESTSTERFQIGFSLRDTSIIVSDLKYGTVYFWYVEAKDLYSDITRSDIWNFATKNAPLNPVLYSYFNNNQYDIYSMDEDGNSQTEITMLQGNELWPRYNKDKRYIAYCRSNGFGADIYIKDIRFEMDTKITELPIAGYHNSGFGFSWTKNGDIVYPHYNKLIQIDINGFNKRILIEAPQDRNFRECDYSPIENKLVVLTVGINPFDSEIYLYEESSDSLKLLVGNLPGIMERPSFTVDGKKILFTRDVSGLETLDGRQLDTRVFLLNLSTSDITDLSLNKEDGTNDMNPRISSDGAYVILNNVRNNESAQPEIIIMDLMGLQRKSIATGGIMADWK